MSSRPYMKLFVGDFLSDTQGLNMQELGAYLTLLMYQWNTGEAIPQDRLHIVCRMTKRDFLKIKPHLFSFFIEEKNGFWSNNRVAKDLAEFHAVKAAQSARGRAAARIRWKTQE